MKNPILIAVGGAIAIGLIAVILASFWMSSSSEPKTQTITIVQSTNDIEMGSKIPPESLVAVPWAGGEMPQGAIFNVANAANRIAKVKITRGQTILESMLVPAASGDDLSSDIPLGKRAFTIAINEISGVGGFASPGNYVDVIVSARDQMGQPISKTVIDHVKVLAVAQTRSFNDPTPKLGTNVTLEVTPEEAQKLDVARSLGTLSLVLRNRVDKESYEGAAVGKNDLMLSPNTYNDATVEIIRGNLSSGGASSVDYGNSQNAGGMSSGVTNR